MTKRRQPSRPSLLTRVKFVNEMHAIIYTLLIAEIYALAAEDTRADANEATTWDEAAELGRKAVKFDRTAQKLRYQGVNDLATLYGLGEEHLPYIDAFLAPVVGAWATLDAALVEACKEVAIQEGLTPEHARYRSVHTILRWR